MSRKVFGSLSNKFPNDTNCRSVAISLKCYTVGPRSTDFPKTNSHDTAEKHKTTDGFPIENRMLRASEMRTFRVPGNGQNRIPTPATPY